MSQQPEMQRSSPWDRMPTRPRPKSPKPPPFAALKERLGVQDAPVELEPVEGTPAGACCELLADGSTCEGNVLRRRDGDFVVHQCESCRFDHGSVHVRRADPSVRHETWLEQAQLPAQFADRTFERDEENAPALAALRQWLDSFDGSAKRADRPATLLPAPCLYGLLGRGKTLLLVKTCQRVIEECDLPVAFRSARGLLRDLQRFDNDVIRGEAWERAMTVDVLALDDLGAERTTDWRLDQLAHLIDERYQRQLPILVATNYQLAQWEEVLDARTVSRLAHMTFPIELKGPDRRLEREAA